MKKGLDPVVSAVIMLMVGVVTAIVVSNWLSTFSQEKASDIKNSTQEQLSCKFADLFIKNATFDCANNCAVGFSHNTTVTIVNSGKKSVTVNKIVIQNTTGHVYNLNLNETKYLNIGETLTLVNVSYGSCSGINRSIEKIIISSSNCPLSASDSAQGSSVSFIRC